MPFFDLILNKNFILVFVFVLWATIYVNYSSWSDVFAQNTASGNSDDKDPIINIPLSPEIYEATGPQGSLVSYNVSATNATGTPIRVNCIPPSGSMFALGTSTVDCTARDGGGNDAKASFEVIVQDTTPPTTELGIVKTGWMGVLLDDEFTNSDDIGFSFTGSDLVGVKGFECKLDNGNWQPSTIDYQEADKSGCYYLNLETGPHTFQVRAIDTSNNKDPNPQLFSWTIISIEDAIVNLRDFVSTIIMPPNLKEELSDSLNNAIGNIQDDGSYDHLICEYLDSFGYSFSKASVLDLFNQDVTNHVDNSFTSIRDRTGCNPPVISLENEITVDEGTKGVILDASGSFDSKDGKSLEYEWSQIAGIKVDLFNNFKSKASFDTPILDGTSNQVILFKVKVTDKNNLSSEKTIKVIIRNLAPPNNPPVADDQRVSANTADPTEITLTATDPGGNPLTYAIVSQPQSGTITDLNKDTGSLVYTSKDGFTGEDRFTFKANDGTVDSNTATVRVTVSSVSSQTEPEPEPEPEADNSAEDTIAPGSSKDSKPQTSKPADLNSTNFSSGLFSDGFPGFTDNMKNLFDN